MFIDMILMQALQNFKMLIFLFFFIKPTCTLKSTNVKQKLVNFLIHKIFKAWNNSMLYSYICKTFPEIKIFFLPLEYSNILSMLSYIYDCNDDTQSAFS